MVYPHSQHKFEDNQKDNEYGAHECGSLSEGTVPLSAFLGAILAQASPTEFILALAGHVLATTILIDEQPAGRTRCSKHQLRDY